MRRKLVALLLSGALAALSGCAPGGEGCVGLPQPPSPAPSPEAAVVRPEAVSFDDYAGQRAVVEENPLSGQVFAAVRDFAVGSAPLVLDRAGENGLYSPLSLWYALEFCADFSGGASREQILAARRSYVHDRENEAAGCGNFTPGENARPLYRQLYTDNEMGKLLLDTSLWLNRDYRFVEGFPQRAAEGFYAEAYWGDFSDPAIGAAMGAWVSEHTGALLGGAAMELDRETVMVLLTTLYFSDQWVDRFDKAENTRGMFRNADGTEAPAEYMNRTCGSHLFRTGEGFTASGLGLKNGGTMTFILPDEDVTPEALLSDPDRLYDALYGGEDGGRMGEVIFQVPKFTLSDKRDLRPVLEAMGITAVFQDYTNSFSAVSPDPIALSGVRQETALSINENGVTAAAFTRLDYDAGAAPPDGRAELILDRPFLFAVTAPNGVPLFIGAVNDLSA